jgi:pyruvate dehydrogenase E2 component (dihydrolipoamide acetyltransferase)
VKKGAVLCEVETDKAVMDYESSASGRLLKIVKGEGEKAAVGDLIAVIGVAGEDIAAVVAETAAAPAPQAAPTPAASAAPAAPATPATSPTTSAAPASRPQSSTAPSAPASGAAFSKRSSPLARVLAHQAGIDVRDVAGSGPAGRVVRRDIEAFIAAGPSARPASPTFGAVPVAPADRRESVSRIRAVTARRLVQSMQEAPHFFLRVAVEAERLLAFRAAVNEGRADAEKVSLNALFVKLTAAALSEHPAINASWGGDSIVYHGSSDIALAVALKDGLVAPVVRFCERKGALAIETEFRALIAKAKSSALRPEDYEGATFTISNLGAWGIEEFTAIINPPGSAILALGAIVKEAVVRTGPDGVESVVPRSMLRATLSCDHRVIDGAVGASFLRDWKALVEEPARALL